MKMVAAVQPFVSGAISKTFNMSNDATKDDIVEAYMMAWKYGIKAFAVYRDGSKATQPLNTSAENKKKSHSSRKCCGAPPTSCNTRVRDASFCNRGTRRLSDIQHV